MNISENDGYIAGIITGGRILLFIGLFVLFIHDNQIEIAEGEENRRTDSENQLSLPIRSGKDLVPYFQPPHLGKS